MVSVSLKKKSSEFAFRKGPLFTGLLLADEINRTPPKTQSALLESMQEHQVTVEYEGTYPLPEAQLDRFLTRIAFGYPSSAEEAEVLQRRLARRREEQTLRAVADPPTLLAMQAAIETVTVDDTVTRYCVDLAAATRTHAHILVGASPRGALGLLLAARALAVVRGRDFVIPEDVKAVAHAVLEHRLTLKPELWMTRVTSGTVVSDVLGSVAAPSPREQA